jgi:hypothetical protein
LKFCPVVPEICRGQVHGARKERRIKIRIIIIIIIIRNGAKTISLPNFVFSILASLGTPTRKYNVCNSRA